MEICYAGAARRFDGRRCVCSAPLRGAAGSLVAQIGRIAGCLGMANQAR